MSEIRSLLPASVILTTPGPLRNCVKTRQGSLWSHRSEWNRGKSYSIYSTTLLTYMLLTYMREIAPNVHGTSFHRIHCRSNSRHQSSPQNPLFPPTRWLSGQRSAGLQCHVDLPRAGVPEFDSRSQFLREIFLVKSALIPHIRCIR